MSAIPAPGQAPEPAVEQRVFGPRFDRLHKLLEHMESGTLSVDRFHFGCFRERNDCGTMGCMGGELPALWPEEWERRGRVTPQRLGSGLPFVSAAADFFGVSLSDIMRLFYPSVLPETASRAEVAANLRAFIERTEIKRREWEALRG